MVVGTRVDRFVAMSLQSVVEVHPLHFWNKPLLQTVNDRSLFPAPRTHGVRAIEGYCIGDNHAVDIQLRELLLVFIDDGCVWSNVVGIALKRFQGSYIKPGVDNDDTIVDASYRLSGQAADHHYGGKECQDDLFHF